MHLLPSNAFATGPVGLPENLALPAEAVRGDPMNEDNNRCLCWLCKQKPKEPNIPQDLGKTICLTMLGSTICLKLPSLVKRDWAPWKCSMRLNTVSISIYLEIDI